MVRLVKTKVESLEVKKFRGLEGIKIPLADRITVICGKNGTSKTTILGLVAQIFSHRTNYGKTPVTKGDLQKHRPLFQTPNYHFESVFGEHFRFSEKYDQPGDMEVSFKVHDAKENKIKDNLKLKIYDSKDRTKARPVLRGNKDRNISHPVIYLSTNRLLPITKRPKYLENEVEYIKENESWIKYLNDKILNKDASTSITSTTGTVSSLAITDSNYDKDSISVGEDNTGQILLALLSFKKLKEETDDYYGGVLLIDEADAGLFPSAQKELVSVLAKVSRDLNLQILLTTHSPEIIEEVIELEKNDKNKYKNIYLTDTYGSLKVLENKTWAQILADLRTTTISLADDLNLPEVNIYFEDDEAYELYRAIITSNKLRKISNKMRGVSLGGEQYAALYESKVPEFNKYSVIVIDPDKVEPKIKQAKNIISLPGTVPPDQLLFEFLYRLPPDHNFWHNQINFTKPVFKKIASDIIGLLNLEYYPNVREAVNYYRENHRNTYGQIREKFKEFYKDKTVQSLVKGPVASNPFRWWAQENKKEADDFRNEYEKALIYVLKKGLQAPSDKVNEFFK